MDIHDVLAVLRPGEDWGTNGSNELTYDKLLEGWRGKTPCPTREEMRKVWDEVIKPRLDAEKSERTVLDGIRAKAKRGEDITASEVKFAVIQWLKR